MPESVPSKEACVEKAELLLKYQKATRGHSAAVRALAQTVDAASHIRYEELRKAAENARQAANEARWRLDAHIAQHGY